MGNTLQTADFDFELPPELIAQSPATERDQSRMLVLNRATGQTTHSAFRDLVTYLRQGDVLVLNNSRVIPARLHGINARSGGRFEILLLEENSINDWWAMLRPGKRARVGSRIQLTDLNGDPVPVEAIVVDVNDDGHRRLEFSGTKNLLNELDSLGQMPLPPYITRNGSASQDLDRVRYQTVFADPAGSVAAPTAGLHFTESLLNEIRSRGVSVHSATLHVGPGTFAPVKTETLAAHTMHKERFELRDETVNAIEKARQNGGRVVAVGTTTVRLLESVAAQNEGRPKPVADSTRIFIYPPFKFRVVDALLTNFHLPCSTLLMLVSAFAAPGELRGRELVLAAYEEAIRQRYRFFSYGDAMLLL
jgi:S-adenosylmethionine:tRNA ribosyltransferase-isomerase